MSLFHDLTGEGRPVQRRTLFLLARYLELPFLASAYSLMRGSWTELGRRRSFRWLYARLVTRPLANHGDAGQPVPCEQVLAEIDRLDGAIAVGPCRCRMTNNACDHPLETDIVVRTGTEAWLRAFPEQYRVIDRGEAKEIVRRCHELGMMQMAFFHCPSSGNAEYVICNCCTCGCTVYVLNRGMGQTDFPLRVGDWRAETDPDRCTGEARCVDSCPFDARVMVHGKGETRGCFGCGLCVDACPHDAIVLHPRGAHAGHVHEAQPS